MSYGPRGNPGVAGIGLVLRVQEVAGGVVTRPVIVGRGWEAWCPDGWGSKPPYVVALPMTGEIGKDPFKPSLTGHDRPADKIGWTKYRSVKVPFAAIRVSGRDLQWQLGNSPFYTIESWRAHSLVACADNVISLNQKVGDTITTGISKTSTDTFKASATVTVSAEAGIQIPGVGGAKASTSVAVTLGYEHSTGVAVTLGYEHSTSVTVLQRQRRVAEAMQRHLLPHLPNVPGLQMTARYLPSPARLAGGR
ncbi:hypothetical protein [Streptomyces sp. 1114.5]|uniref:hypothetical protein n=1 Tax=Streptomyces sp. 1114.5 TaxID=1938830 RepID=UPI001603E916